MDFDSSLFDLPFEDLACLGLDSQQLQQPLAAIDFQDFCKDFATNDFAVDTTDNDSPAWGVEAATESSEQDTAVTTKSEDFLSSLDKSVFDPLEPLDSSFDNLFGSNVGSDAQVVPDMAPMEANAPEFAMPTYTQASPYIAPKTVAPGIGLQTRPYSWMNSMDYPLFGWPARTRLPSKIVAKCIGAGCCVTLLACSNLIRCCNRCSSQASVQVWYCCMLHRAGFVHSIY